MRVRWPQPATADLFPDNSWLYYDGAIRTFGGPNCLFPAPNLQYLFPTLTLGSADSREAKHLAVLTRGLKDLGLCCVGCFCPPGFQGQGVTP